MTTKQDDYDALRTIVQTLEPFEEADRSRIIRWACEKLNISPGIYSKPPSPQMIPNTEMAPSSAATQGSKDIGSFINQKAPKSDNQFAAVVAYYYKFEAPADQRKDSISGSDLQEACRLSGRSRLTHPAQTLVNTFTTGYLDKADYGKYKLNTVGENLVAMVLPAGASNASTKHSGRIKKKKKKTSR